MTAAANGKAEEEAEDKTFNTLQRLDSVLRSLGLRTCVGRHTIKVNVTASDELL